MPYEILFIPFVCVVVSLGTLYISEEIEVES